MFRNYYFLARLAAELNQYLAGSELQEAFSQEKDKLLLCFSTGNNDAFLEVSAEQSLPYASLRQSFSRAKRNTAGFWEQLLPQAVHSVDIAVFERVIRITLTDSFLYIAIRGRLSNIILRAPNGQWHFFKESKAEDSAALLEELTTLEFTTVPPMPPADILTTVPDALLIEKVCPPIGKDIATEARQHLTAGISNAVTTAVLNVLGGEFAVWQNPVTKETGFYPASFSPAGMSPVKSEGDFLTLASDYLRLHFASQAFSSKYQIVEAYLNSELRTMNKRVTDLARRVSLGNREAEYSLMAGLLAANRAALTRGLNQITLTDEYGSGEAFTIPLKPDKSPQENIDLWFEKARSEKTNYKHSTVLLKNYNIKLERFNRLANDLRAAESLQQLEKMMASLKIDTKSTPGDEPKMRFKHFVIDGEWHAYVGKDSKNNDLLTLHFAKQNDIWMHARGVSGSHVVLRAGSNATPKPILKKTAALAAFFSKAKTAGITPVAWTQKKYVVKRKGMEPGKVALLREEVLLVKPEVPQGCIEVFD